MTSASTLLNAYVEVNVLLVLAALAAWSWPRLAPNRVTIWLPPMIIAAALIEGATLFAVVVGLLVALG